jgi:hypothetical protein
MPEIGTARLKAHASEQRIRVAPRNFSADYIEFFIPWRRDFGAFRIAVLAGFDQLLDFAERSRITNADDRVA